jgi:DNA adenine methylase
MLWPFFVESKYSHRHIEMTTAPLKYHGGKHYLRKKIWELAPADYVTRIIPYAGAINEFWDWKCPHCGVVPPEHTEGCQGVAEVINDINEELMNFYKVLRSSQRQELLEQLQLTPFHESDFNYALSGSPDLHGRVGSAWAFFVKYRMSRQALGKDFATPTCTRTRRKGNEQTSAWLSAVDGLDDCIHRLERVLVYCRPGLSVLKAFSKPSAFAYLDPPYHPSTRVAGDYAHEMTDADHAALLTYLMRFKGKFLLSGYRCEMYDDFAEQAGWERIDVEQAAHSSSAETKPVRVESFWRNYSA